MKKLYKPFKLLFVLLLGLNLGAFAQTSTYLYTGGVQTYTVGPGVTGITVNVRGAEGGWNSDTTDYFDKPGFGACVIATLTVTPGQVLNLYVGGKGQNGTDVAGGLGGWNGGGHSDNAYGLFSGGGGGGASDIRIGASTLADRIVVAAGGGGSGLGCGADKEDGGNGGAAVGQTGVALCGTETGGGGGQLFSTPAGGGAGGTCSGGCGGLAGSPGSLGQGGDAGGCCDTVHSTGSTGGGGGGGYWGGGGGQWSGGGGGSDYTDPA